MLVPWCDRPELGVALAANKPLLARQEIEVIVVNAGGNFEYLTNIVKEAGLTQAMCIDLTDANFNRSLCLNIGASASRMEYLFCLDSDIILNCDVFMQAAEALRRGGYVAVRTIRESNPAPDAPNWAFLSDLLVTKEIVTKDGRRAVLTNRLMPDLHGGDGLVLLSKRAMYSVGGLNSAFKGWGYEDTDFQIRLQLGLGLERTHLGEVTHLSHSAAGRDHDGWRRNMSAAYQNYNRGCFLGSLEEDWRSWRDKLCIRP